MKILFDTNVLISSIITHGICFEVFEYCLRNHEIITSKYIINEFNEKLKEKFKYTDSEIKEASNTVFERLNIIEPTIYENKTISDKDDLAILGTAIAGKCSCIITGDNELLRLKTIKGIDIISPSEFWEYQLK